MRRAQSAFEYMLLMAGILMIALVAFFLLRNTTANNSISIGFSQCKTQIALASVCYGETGQWKANETAINDSLFGIDIACTKDLGGGLSNTQWDVLGTDDQFKCGSSAPT